jgi:shikimate kinase
MPAAGKTTLGYALAQHLGWPFVDLDDVIEQQTGRTVTSIFVENDEHAFREIEHEVLHSVLEYPQRHVVATGGGTPCFFANMDTMLNHGRTIYLSVKVPELLRRLQAYDTHRPLISGKLESVLELYLEQLLHEREPYYARAHGIVQRDAATLQDIVACL